MPTTTHRPRNLFARTLLLLLHSNAHVFHWLTTQQAPSVYVAAEDDKRDLIGIIMHEYTLYFERDTMNGGGRHTPGGGGRIQDNFRSIGGYFRSNIKQLSGLLLLWSPSH